jgi:hypothetical protein
VVIACIDPPLRYAPKQEWREFLARMMALDQSDPMVQHAIEQANRVLSEQD